MCGDADRAADAMQDAFIRAYDGLAGCREPDRFGSWFFRILTNQCHNHRRRSRTHQSLDTVTVSSPDSPERDVVSAEIRQAIDQALDGLSPELRETFVLREIEGRPYPEIATLLETTEPALRKRVERARQAVRSALEEWL
jgi:RNA polymerase sigma-70 factor (ECF subfamily)